MSLVVQQKAEQFHTFVDHQRHHIIPAVPPPTPEDDGTHHRPSFVTAERRGTAPAGYNYDSSWRGVISFFNKNYWYHVNHSATSSGVQASDGSTTTGGDNVAAIDNKIEQAMDLVKTHLTYAVREEVEVLRSTIENLNNRVAVLEKQNEVLRQFAPAEVVAQLSTLTAQMNNNNNSAAAAGSSAASPRPRSPAATAVASRSSSRHASPAPPPQLAAAGTVAGQQHKTSTTQDPNGGQ